MEQFPALRKKGRVAPPTHHLITKALRPHGWEHLPCLQYFKEGESSYVANTDSTGVLLFRASTSASRRDESPLSPVFQRRGELRGSKTMLPSTTAGAALRPRQPHGMTTLPYGQRKRQPSLSSNKADFSPRTLYSTGWPPLLV